MTQGLSLLVIFILSLSFSNGADTPVKPYPDHCIDSEGIPFVTNDPTCIKRFVYVKIKMTWREGVKFCRERGMTFASLRNNREEKALKELRIEEGVYDETFWFGGQKERSRRRRKRDNQLPEGKYEGNWGTGKADDKFNIVCHYFGKEKAERVITA